MSTRKTKPANPVNANKIGTRNESSLHRTLKYQYAGDDGKTEVAAGEYVADVKKADGEYIEVQTGSFAPLKNKVKEFAAAGKVRIIHPIPIKKIIEVYEPAERASKEPLGALLYRRKSPLKNSHWNIFDALLHAPLLPLTKGLTIEIALVEITEKRIKDGKGARRRKRISIYDKSLAAFHESILLEKKSDWLMFVPFKKNEEFTSSLLAEKANINIGLARKVLYVLTKMNLVRRTGKNGNSWVYVR